MIAERTEPETATVLVVEDEIVTGALMRSILERRGYRVSAVHDVAAATIALEELRPHVALLDVALARGSGIDFGAELARRGVPFVYVTGLTDPTTLLRAGATRPLGFVSKPFSEDQLVGAVRVALGGAGSTDRYQSAIMRITSSLVELGVVRPEAADGTARVTPELASLSPREWEVLRGLLAHKRVPTIARELFISASTVRNHLKSIFAKVGVHSQSELLEKVTRRG
jgi:two-component system response regulator FixJ